MHTELESIDIYFFYIQMHTLVACVCLKKKYERMFFMYCMYTQINVILMCYALKQNFSYAKFNNEQSVEQILL